MSKTKVLSLGLSQINFLEQLYKPIKDQDSSFCFDVDDFLNHGTIQPDRSIFNNSYTFSKSKFPTYLKIKYFFKSISRKLFWKQLFLEIHANGFRSVFAFLKESIRNYYITSELIIPLNHDVYHFHSIVKPNVKYAQYLPKEKKIICSFWGLDLYQRWGTNNYYYVSLALNKASVITVQSVEMKEVLLAKFGATLRDKTKVITFPLKQDVFGLIDKLKDKDEIQNDFKLKIGIKDLTKRVVSIGYNASSNAQHIPILETLNQLSDKTKNKIVCILPLTYGKEESYLEELDTCIEGLENMEVLKISKYLTWEELALLKIVTNVILQMPLNDALSSAVLEVMYAGNIAVTGNWLPYGIYKRNGIEHLELDNVNNLIEIFENEEFLKTVPSDDSKKIRDLFLSSELIEKWINIYR